MSYNTGSKALIYPAGTVAGYGLIYSLGIAGIHVVAAHHSRNHNFHSKYVRERYIVPDPVNDHEGFVDWLVSYGRAQAQKPVLFMAEDLFAYIASLYQDRLSMWYLYPWIPIDKLEMFFNKKYMFKHAADAGLNVPGTLIQPSLGQLEKWDIFPCLIKPLVARFTFRDRRLVNSNKFPLIFGNKALGAANAKELIEKTRKVESEGIEYCVQEYIAGPNHCLALVKFVSKEDFTIPASFTSIKTRQQPADFGTCCVSSSLCIPELHEMAEKFCVQAGYCGPGGMEFKLKDKKWYFIEMNSRLDFYIRMAALKGINLPLQQYLLSTGRELLVKKQVCGGRYWIDIVGDIAGYKWSRTHKEWPISITQFLKPYLCFNEAVLNCGDPVPGILRLLRMIKAELALLIKKKI